MISGEETIMKHGTTFKVKKISTSASQVGERKAYRMTGKVSGSKAKGYKKKSSHNPY